MNLSILYRGPLTSCNYACAYCPFAKRTETAAQLQRDRDSLARFTDWTAKQTQHKWRILFTPWGEALVRAWYRDALIALSHVPQVASVSIQTNLACGLAWIQQARRDRLALWVTFHPTQVDRAAFLGKVMQLREWGVRFSVGIVGVPECVDEITELRRALPSDVYLWINAQQPRRRPYTASEVATLSAIDPYFELTMKPRPSLGKSCRTGHEAFTVDGKGDMRRCHFVEDVIGNIYEPDWEISLQTRLCPNRFCKCYIGKAQLESSSLEGAFGDNLLERILVPSGAAESKFF